MTLELHLQLRNGVLGTALPAGGARLDDELGEEVAERVALLPSSAAVHLRVHLASGPAHDDIPGLIRNHFANRRERAEFRLRRAVRAGRLSLVLGTLVLLIALALAQVAGRVTTGGLATILREGLTIVGWVALWRPLDLLLFERWVVRRDIALYRRLESMEITVAAAG